MALPLVDHCGKGTMLISKSPLYKVSKQIKVNKSLYFVKENYKTLSTEVSAWEKQGQSSGGPHRGVIGSLGILSVVWPFGICSRVGSLFIVKVLHLPTSCEVSLRKLFQNKPFKCSTS